MVANVLKLVGFDLQRQLARVKAEAENFRDRTTEDIRHKAVDAGLIIVLAFTGLVFVVLAAVAGLIALYLWVEMKRGAFAGLGAVALAAAVLAVLMFIVAATRGKKGGRPARRPMPSPVEYPAAMETPVAAVSRVAPPAPPASAYTSGPASAAPNASFVDTITKDLTDRTVSAANEALDTAAGIVRKSPPEAILAALAVAVVAGIFVGRRRGASN